jgi:hypothetical protein
LHRCEQPGIYVARLASWGFVADRNPQLALGATGIAARDAGFVFGLRFINLKNAIPLRLGHFEQWTDRNVCPTAYENHLL